VVHDEILIKCNSNPEHLYAHYIIFMVYLKPLAVNQALQSQQSDVYGIMYWKGCRSSSGPARDTIPPSVWREWIKP
jgi:hypothetical protein